MTPDTYFYSWCALLFVLFIMIPIAYFVDQRKAGSADEAEDMFTDDGFGDAAQAAEEEYGEEIAPEPVAIEEAGAVDDFGAAEFEAFE